MHSDAQVETLQYNGVHLTVMFESQTESREVTR